MTHLPTLQTMGRFGRMNVDRWFSEGHFGKRVFLDGVDITDICRSFDDHEGVAECLCQPLDIDFNDHVATEFKHGRIEVRP